MTRARGSARPPLSCQRLLVTVSPSSRCHLPPLSPDGLRSPRSSVQVLAPCGRGGVRLGGQSPSSKEEAALGGAQAPCVPPAGSGNGVSRCWVLLDASFCSSVLPPGHGGVCVSACVAVLCGACWSRRARAARVDVCCAPSGRAPLVCVSGFHVGRVPMATPAPRHGDMFS